MPCFPGNGPGKLPAGLDQLTEHALREGAVFFAELGLDGVYGPLGRVGPKYLPGRARLAAPVLAVRPPGGTTQGPSGTAAADAQAAINSLPADR
jgi:hypothetical protein